MIEAPKLPKDAEEREATLMKFINEHGLKKVDAARIFNVSPSVITKWTSKATRDKIKQKEKDNTTRRRRKDALRLELLKTLTPPPLPDDSHQREALLRELKADYILKNVEIAKLYNVSSSLVTRWLSESSRQKLRTTRSEWGVNNKAKINEFARDRRRRNSEKYRTRDRRYCERNRDKLRIRSRDYYHTHRTENLQSAAKYRQENREVLRQKVKKWREENRDTSQAATKSWEERNPEKVAEQRRRTKDLYPNRQKQRNAFYLYLIDGQPGSIASWVRCAPDKLFRCLEYQFEEGMSWDNYGRVWFVGFHESFDYEDLEAARVGWHYRNLKPTLYRNEE